MDGDWHSSSEGRKEFSNTLPCTSHAPGSVWSVKEVAGTTGISTVQGGLPHTRQLGGEGHVTPGKETVSVGDISTTEKRGGNKQTREDTHEEGDDELLGLVVQFEDPSTPTASSHKACDTLSLREGRNTGVGQRPPPPLQPAPHWSHAVPSPTDKTKTESGNVKHEQQGQSSSRQVPNWVDIGSALERWQGIGSAHSLSTGQEIARFLIQHYEDTLAGKHYNDRCVHCQSLLSMSCCNCGWSTPHPNTHNASGGSATAACEMDASDMTDAVSCQGARTADHSLMPSTEQRQSLPESPTGDDGHDSPGSPPAVCECQICQASFTDPGLLTLHLQAHLDEILYKCQETRRQAGFPSDDLTFTAPRIQSQTTQAGEGLVDSCVKQSTVAKRQKKTHRFQTGDDAEQQTGGDAEQQTGGDAEQQTGGDVKQETSDWEAETKRERSSKQTTKLLSAVKKPQAGSESTKSDGSIATVVESKPRGFSMIRWRQQRGEGLVAGQPTRCTQTPASDPLMPFVCLQCDAKFEHEHKLVMHLRKHTGERPYRCKECNATFAQTSHLKQHLRTHTGEKPHACPHCPARFARSGALASHINIHTGAKPHKCELCPAAFSHRTTLSSHMKVHTGAKPYLCPECGRTFAHTSNLKKHRITHTGLRPYICHQCSKAFSDPVNLKRHIRTHSGVKPYKCDQCLKAFATSDALKVHMRTHSGERPYSCQHCPKAFTTFQSLTKHISTQHRLATDLA